jgi:VanZ family protein
MVHIFPYLILRFFVDALKAGKKFSNFWKYFLYGTVPFLFSDIAFFVLGVGFGRTDQYSTLLVWNICPQYVLSKYFQSTYVCNDYKTVRWI